MEFDTVSPSDHPSGITSRSGVRSRRRILWFGFRRIFSFRVVTYRSPMAGAWRRTAAVAVLVGCALTACGRGGEATLSADQEGASLLGGVLRPANVEPDLTLTDTAGRAYNVKARNAGKVTLLYFGYTHCPDVCPTTMADIAQALRESPAAVRRQVTVIFVTVDPHRDSGRVVRHWLDNFSPDFIGLRGSLPEVIAAQRAAHLPVSKVSKNGKTVEHSAEVVAYTPDAKAHVIYFDGPSTIGDLRHDLPILVSGQGYAAG
jgi:protein SCO1/2